MPDLVDVSGNELYIQELEHQLEDYETMLRFFKENRANIQFTKDAVYLKVGGSTVRTPTVWDAYEELRDRP